MGGAASGNSGSGATSETRRSRAPREEASAADFAATRRTASRAEDGIREQLPRDPRARREPVAAAAPRFGALVGDLLFALGLFLLFVRGFLTLLWRAVCWLVPRLWSAIVWIARGVFWLGRMLIAVVVSRSSRRKPASPGRRTNGARTRASGGQSRRMDPGQLARSRSGSATQPTFGLLRFWVTTAVVLLIAAVAVLATQPTETAVASAPPPRAATPTAGSNAISAAISSAAAPARSATRVLAATPTVASFSRSAAAVAAPVTAAALAPSSCPALPANSARLGATVDAEISRHAGHYGVAVLNLGTNEAYVLNADERFPAGSVYKLAIMYEAWRRVQLDTLSPDAKITITPADALEPEPRGGVALGTQITVREALRAMITVSSNNAAHALLRTLGRDAVNRSTRDLGLRDTLLPTPVRPTGVADDDGSDVAVSSPRDALCFMNLLARDRLLAPAQNVEMRAVLFQQQINDRLPALLPEDANVAHKTGEITGVRNDVGIIYTPQATWVVAVFSRDVDEGEATAVIARLSKRLYEQFVGPIAQ